MTKRKNDVPDNIRTMLIVPKVKLKQQLEDRIELGLHLTDPIIRDQSQLKELRREFIDWNDYNKELLKGSLMYLTMNTIIVTKKTSLGLVAPIVSRKRFTDIMRTSSLNFKT